MVNLAATNSKNLVCIIHENFFTEFHSPMLRMCVIHK